MTLPAVQDAHVIPGTRLGPYVVNGALGYGAMGVVYRARHVATGASVAVKRVRLPSADLASSFRREVYALRELHHPGIVKLLDEGLAEEAPWYAMELVEGYPLARVLPGAFSPNSGSWPPEPGTTEPARDLSIGESDFRSGLRPGSLPADAARPEDRPPINYRVQSLSPLALLAILRKVCDALAYMHGRGLVHRDLKPDNILIRQGGEPVIADFGIVAKFAGSAGREALDIAVPQAGTLAYMAPEQHLGRGVDARADLFSFGCILYQALTGVLPFGMSGVGRFRSAAPPAPSAAGGLQHEELDRTTLRLLAREPRDRIGYAEDVAAVLARVVSAVDPETSRPEPGSPEPSRPERRSPESKSPASRPPASRSGQPNVYLYRADLTAREPLLGRMDGLLTRALAGDSASVLVSGESGLGKTRLLVELAGRATARGLRVIVGECSPAGVVAGAEIMMPCAPLSPFRGLFASLIDDSVGPAASEAPVLLRRYGAVLAPYDPELGEIVQGEAPPEPMPPQAARARVVSSLRRLLVDYAAARPLLLCLDDLQWADELTLALLVAIALDPCPGVLVVATCRAEEMSDAVSAWADEPRVMKERLERLDRDAVGRMVRGMLALDDPPGAVIDQLVAESGGNPFFVAETLRAAIGDGLLARDTSGKWTFGSIATAFAGGRPSANDEPIASSATANGEPVAPSATANGGPTARSATANGGPVARSATTEALIARRLAGLGGGALATLSSAAVLGRRFDFDLLTPTTGRSASDVNGAYGLLRVREILQESGAEVSFVHDYLREAIYARTEPDERAALHARAAAAIEERYAGSLDAHLAGLGQHHARAGNRARAASYFERAGDFARRGYASKDAIALYHMGLAQLIDADDDGQRCRLHEALGDVLMLVGNAPAARDAYGLALGDASVSTPVARARRRRKLARAWERSHRHDEALVSYALAEAELGDRPPGRSEAAPWWTEWIEIQVERAWDLYFLNRIDELTELVVRLGPIADAHADAGQRARMLLAAAHGDIRRRRYVVAPESLERTTRLVEAAEQAGDVQLLAVARFSHAFLLLFARQETAAEPLLEAALAAAERLGDRALQSRFLCYSAVLHRRLGRVAEAGEAAERTLACAAATQMLDYLGAAEATLAWVASRQGRPIDVARHASRALALWSELRSRYVFPFEWLARVPLAANHLGLFETHTAGMAFPNLRTRPEPNFEAAIEQWALLLDTAQQRLSEPLESAIRIAVSASPSEREACCEVVLAELLATGFD